MPGSRCGRSAESAATRSACGVNCADADCRPVARREGAGQAAEARRDHDHGRGGPELECAPAGAAAACRHGLDDDALERGRAELLRQRAHVARELGAERAAPDVRAQQRLLDLRQLPVEPERGPGTGALALCG